jgi:hypothetical protein
MNFEPLVTQSPHPWGTQSDTYGRRVLTLWAQSLTNPYHSFS